MNTIYQASLYTITFTLPPIFHSKVVQYGDKTKPAKNRFIIEGIDSEGSLGGRVVLRKIK